MENNRKDDKKEWQMPTTKLTFPNYIFLKMADTLICLMLDDPCMGQLACASTRCWITPAYILGLVPFFVPVNLLVNIK